MGVALGDRVPRRRRMQSFLSPRILASPPVTPHFFPSTPPLTLSPQLSVSPWPLISVSDGHVTRLCPVRNSLGKLPFRTEDRWRERLRGRGMRPWHAGRGRVKEGCLALS
jgi:hypothetical protein